MGENGMTFFKTTTLEKVWANIIRHEGEAFYTVARKIPYQYTVKEEYILINNDKKRRITKKSLERALLIANPTPKKIQNEGIWGPSYVCGLLLDNRIL